MGVVLMVVLAVLLCFALLLFLPICLRITYREHVRVTLSFLFLKFSLGKEKKKPLKKQKGKTAPAPKTQKSAPSASSFLKKLRLIRAITATLIRKTKGHVRLTIKELTVKIASEDAAKTAVLYGAASASLAYLMAGAERVSHLKIGSGVEGVVADYLSDRPSATVDLSFSLSAWRSLALLFTLFLTYVRRRKTQQKKTTPSK